MAGLLTAPTFLERLRADGFELAVVGGRLRIRPADRVTPELRDALARRRNELLVLLAPARQFVTLRGGLIIPRVVFDLLLDLERRGFTLTIIPHPGTDEVVVEPAAALTARDRAALHRWRRHVAATIEHYERIAEQPT